MPSTGLLVAVVAVLGLATFGVILFVTASDKPMRLRPTASITAEPSPVQFADIHCIGSNVSEHDCGEIAYAMVVTLSVRGGLGDEMDETDLRESIRWIYLARAGHGYWSLGSFGVRGGTWVSGAAFPAGERWGLGNYLITPTQDIGDFDATYNPITRLRIDGEELVPTGAVGVAGDRITSVVAVRGNGRVWARDRPQDGHFALSMPRRSGQTAFYEGRTLISSQPWHVVTTGNDAGQQQGELVPTHPGRTTVRALRRLARDFLVQDAGSLHLPFTDIDARREATALRSLLGRDGWRISRLEGVWEDELDPRVLSVRFRIISGEAAAILGLEIERNEGALEILTAAFSRVTESDLDQ